MVLVSFYLKKQIVPELGTERKWTQMDRDGHSGNQRDRPRLRDRAAGWLRRWGADLLLVWGAGCVSAGVGWIYPPAGLIAAGVLLIAGGILWAKGEDSS